MRVTIGNRVLLGARHCPRGKVWKKGYKTRKGVRVKGVCIVDRGAPGKGPKILPKPEPGALKGWQKTLPVKERRRIMASISKSEGCATAIRKLNLLRNLTTDRATKTAAVADMAWLRRTPSVCKLKTR